MTKKASRPSFNEKKATQAAILFLKLNGGQQNYMKLIKLMYNMDRQAMYRWGRPITYDDYFALPHGMVGTRIMDKARGKDLDQTSYWNRHIITKGYINHLIEDTILGNLSAAEKKLIEELQDNYKTKTQYEMEQEHHDSFSEWEEPPSGLFAKRQLPKEYEDVFAALGFENDEVEELSKILEEFALSEELA